MYQFLPNYLLKKELFLKNYWAAAMAAATGPHIEAKPAPLATSFPILVRTANAPWEHTLVVHASWTPLTMCQQLSELTGVPLDFLIATVAGALHG
jgi:hypothetical protein